MMDCKKALEEADGDIEKASEILRRKGVAVAAKRSSNETENGLIQGSVDDDYKKASLVEVCCETDFAARTDAMKNFAKDIADSFMEIGRELESIDEFMATEVKSAGISAKAMLDDLISKISEKIVVSRIEVATSSDSELVNVYLHPDGTLGVLVQLATDKPITNELRKVLASLAKDICMQVAVTNPLAISKEDMDPAILDKEREIAGDMVKNSGKPQQVIEKIVEGKVKKFCEENCLLDQKFIKDEKISVRDYIDKIGKQYGLQIRVKRVARFGIKR